MVTELSAGRLSIAVFAQFSALSPVKAGKWRALAFAAPKRSALLPDVPTFAEEGVPNFTMTSWFGVWGPAGMPRPLAVKFQQEVAKIIHEPAFTAEWFTSRGLDPVGETPEQLVAVTRADSARWAKVVKAGGIKVE